MRFIDALARLRQSAAAQMRTHKQVTVRQADLEQLLQHFDRFELESHAAALSHSSITPAVSDVLAERTRQVWGEGWTPQHDDAHASGELARAAACYLLHAGISQAIDGGHISQLAKDGAHDFVPRHWPWARKWWKPKNPRRDLVKATALALAEIERIDRATA
jgi:AcrR family transcriptional regulator